MRHRGDTSEGQVQNCESALEVNLQRRFDKLLLGKFANQQLVIHRQATMAASA